MPQIKNVDAFEKFLQEREIDYCYCILNPADMTPSQLEANVEKIDDIKSKIEKYSTDTLQMEVSPIVVCLGNIILDGHHRWLSNYLNDNTQVFCLKICLEFTEAFKVGHKFNKTVGNNGE